MLLFFILGFNAFQFEPSKFALDYHTIGYTECLSEVERYLTNYEQIDDLVKQRVISHLKDHSTTESPSTPLKDDGQSNNDNNNNLNDKTSTTINKKRTQSSTSSSFKQQQSSINDKQQKKVTTPKTIDLSIKSEFNFITNSQQVNNNLHNLHNLTTEHHNLPLSPPSSSVSPLSTSSSLSSLNSELDLSSQVHHLPYTLLKNKILSYNHNNNLNLDLNSNINNNNIIKITTPITKGAPTIKQSTNHLINHHNLTNNNMINSYNLTQANVHNLTNNFNSNQHNLNHSLNSLKCL